MSVTVSVAGGNVTIVAPLDGVASGDDYVCFLYARPNAGGGAQTHAFFVPAQDVASVDQWLATQSGKYGDVGLLAQANELTLLTQIMTQFPPASVATAIAAAQVAQAAAMAAAAGVAAAIGTE